MTAIAGWSGILRKTIPLRIAQSYQPLQSKAKLDATFLTRTMDVKKLIGRETDELFEFFALPEICDVMGGRLRAGQRNAPLILIAR